LFWDDRWLNREAPADLARNLVLLVPRRVREHLTVRQGLEDQHWTIDITRSMSPAAIAEFLELWAATEDIQLNDREDKLVWRWTRGVHR
jgi:hypothetical protein